MLSDEQVAAIRRDAPAKKLIRNCAALGYTPDKSVVLQCQCGQKFHCTWQQYDEAFCPLETEEQVRCRDAE